MKPSFSRLAARFVSAATLLLLPAALHAQTTYNITSVNPTVVATGAPTYNITSVSPTVVAAGAPGASLVISGNFPAFSSTTYGVCFYTGYGSNAPIIPGGGVAGVVVTVPASSIQQLPPTQFSAGVFTAELYIENATSTCNGTPNTALTNTQNVTITLPTVSSVTAASIPQKNPAISTQPPPFSLIFTGTGYLSNTAVNLTWTAGSGAATVHLASATSVVAKLPTTIPSAVTSVTATLCNHTVTYDFCAAAQTIPLTALAASTGTLTAAPSPANIQQSVTLSAQFAVSGTPANPPGAPTGTVSFTSGATALGAGKLILDKTTGAFTQAPSPLVSQTVYASSMATADFNGDGLPDVFFFDSTSSLHILLATTPYGSFQPEMVTTPDANCSYINSSAHGDINGDGFADIVFSCTNANGNIITDMLLGNGDGTFGTAVSLSGVYGSQVALRDVTGDSIVDLITAGAISPTGSKGFAIFSGDGAGNFTLAFTTPTSTAVGSQFLVADLDGDGRPDLIELNNLSQTSNSIDIYRNQGGTAFGTLSGGVYAPNTSIPLPNTGYSYNSMFLGDFNGDGRLDLGLAINESTPAILTALNTSSSGTIGFAAPKTFTLPFAASSISAADFNGDGFDDILVAGFSGAQVYDSDGAGNFNKNYPGLSVSPTSGYVITGIAVDLNGDGEGDALIFTNTLSAAGSAYNLTSYFTTGFANASLTTTFAQSGTAALAATWPGNINFTGSTANFSLPVNAVASSTSLTTSGTPTEYGQTVTLTSTVTSTATGTPTGTITFKDATINLATVALVGGTASYPTTTLNVGPHTLTATYSGDSVFAASVSGNLSQTVTQAQPVVSWSPSPTTISYGTALVAGQLNAAAASKYVTSVPGTFTYNPVVGTVLTAGTQTLSVTFTPTSTTNFKPATGTASITVTQAVPTVNWTTPSSIVVGTPLSSTQLNATATGVSGSLPGTFIYTPASGTVLTAGNNQSLSVAFTPTDTTDYNNATGGTTISVIPLVISSVSPTGANLDDLAKTITLTGTGFFVDSVVRVNGTAIATTYVSATSLTAVIPTSYFQTVQTLSLTVYDPTQGQTSAATSFAVVAPSPVVVFTGPGTTPPAQQPTLTFTLPNPYPAPLSGTVTLTFAGTGGTDDPAIQFAAGGRTLNFTIAANSTTTPVIQLQSGTVAGTITITLTLTAGGQNVTPANVQPIVITVPPALPSITSETITRSGTTLNVIVHGFSNTREVTQATFHFSGINGSSIADPDISIPATTLFSTWFTNVASQAYGSTFTYTQIFNLNRNEDTVGQVTVTLTNSVGTSTTSTAQ